MKLLALQGGLIAIVDEEDYGNLIKYSWSANRTSTKYYVYTTLEDGKKVTLHRFLMGDPPEGFIIDHINGLTVDCRKENMRFCTTKQNCHNAIMKANNKTGIKGVRELPNGKFQARIRNLDGTRKHLGVFETANEAGIAYATAARNLYGEFANTKDKLWV